MIKKNHLRYAIAAVLSASALASNGAFAVDEVEPNAPITGAQPVDVGRAGTVEIRGSIGLTMAGTPINDLDFYSFQGREGDAVTVDIDGGWKAAGSTERSLDSIVALFGPDMRVLIQSDEVPSTQALDDGSFSRHDPYIGKFALPTTGTYYVGVTGWSSSRKFMDGGRLSTTANTLYNGSYSLIISGITPTAPAPLAINIDIRPGSTDLAVFNPKSKGSLPVAILSSTEFEPLKADLASIRFGANGDEQSLLRCNPQGTDLNKDGRPDLICHFDSEKLHFTVDHSYGTLTGKTDDGREFEARGDLKIVPMRKE